MQICDFDKCTGCGACVNVCPKTAISMVLDDSGKTIPNIDSGKCIECNLCRSTCPVLNPVLKNKPVSVYAAWSRNSKDVELSSSGGIATVLARWILNQKGTVFGAASENAEVRHVAVRSEEDLERIRGSKYVQSEIGFAYREAKKLLQNDEYVMFVGTPCQIAGLKNFLKRDYEKLYTVDLICHGNPPQKYLIEHNNAVLHGKPWHKVAFRGKCNFVHTLYAHSDIVYQRKSSRDYYFSAFLNALTYRENCYSCPYACPERCSDITVADFWGINRGTLIHPYDGRISLVLANTEKGKRFFGNIETDIIFEERTLEEAKNPVQTNINHPSVAHPDRALFLELYSQHGFETAVQKTSVGKKVHKSQINGYIHENAIANLLRKMLKKG